MRSNLRIPGTNTISIVRDEEGGFVAQGPGFYVWDEDPDEVLRVTRELDRGNFKVRPSKRMLVMQQSNDEPGA